VPMYVLLSTLTPEGRKTLHDRPARLDAVNQEIEAIGCKVIIQFALLGQYDFMTVIEAPDNTTAALLSIDLGARGTVEIVTLPAVPIDDLEARIHHAERLGRSGP
jgi:uncharacterized protein with GYD domain